MAETSALNSIQLVKRNELMNSIKKENEVNIKPEPLECAVCVTRSTECVDVGAAQTAAGTLLREFLCKFTQSDLVADTSRYVCKTCRGLIDELEQAELKYLMLKESFEAIISKNPLFDQHTRENIVNSVKEERDYDDELYEPPRHDDDSEDEPLAVTKKKRHRKVVKRKKKVYNAPKRKPRGKKENHVEDDKEMVAKEVELTLEPVLQEVKKEDSMDGSMNTGTDSEFKLEMDFDDDDDDSTFIPELMNGAGKLLAEQRKTKAPVGRPRKKEQKTMHQCDQCDAKYTSFKRLEIHKEKHLEGKPPFICEVCGAHYKHKRACDIHVALHKGISDWKCEECNKLFPSKGALQRHNNIHTGKLNYQCDLCGKSFIHTSSFKMHKLSHSGVKPHACDVCGLALMTRSHLKRHKRIHSGEKRHECHVCGKRFSERYNLIAHGRAHEGAAPGVAGAGIAAAPRRRTFRCSFCPERFERRYMLERHVSAAHGRTLERAPATPRNTMSKLLKAQAAARALAPPPHTPSDVSVTDTKEERSPDSRASSNKIQLASVTTISSAGSWSGAYAVEFGIRPEFPH